MSVERSISLWKLAVVALVVVAAGAVITRTARAPDVADAEAFMGSAEAELRDLGIMAGRSQWVQQTYIMHDTELLNAELSKRFSVAQQRLAVDAQRFANLKLSPDLARKFQLLRLAN